MSTPPPHPPLTPEEEYSRRLVARKVESDRLNRLHRTLGNAKLALLALAAVLAYYAYGAHFISGWTLLVPLFAMILVARRHDAVLRRLRAAVGAVSYYERGLRRLGDAWRGEGPGGSRFLKRDHPYAIDLDLFGTGSLYQRLCAARTEAGEACLARWLCQPAEPDVIRSRQAAVNELGSRLELREEMSVLGEEARAGLQPGAITSWSAPPALPHLPQLRALAAGMIAVNAAAVGLAVAGYGVFTLMACVMVEQAILWRYRPSIARIKMTIERPARSLRLIAGLLARLEPETFTSPLLLDISGRLSLEGRPSQRVERLQRYCELLEFGNSALHKPIDALVLWTFQASLAAEGWRAHNGPQLAQWLSAMGELEALLSIATYRYERPGDPFPEILDSGASLHGVSVGHPLLPAASMVRNDLVIGPERRVAIVSGSNMSGKSTYLRTIGINTVLALAGAPVCAERLALSVWQIGTSIQTVDSLREGISRFYAELLRLRQIMDITGGTYPVLFLLDEILHGTNSHDRLVGAEAIVRSLAQRGASGLVTTHDLALAHIVEDNSLYAVNLHFADDIVDGKMNFDYHVRPGVVQQSNALALMRLVGLDV